jgi:hypothetical protein
MVGNGMEDRMKPYANSLVLLSALSLATACSGAGDENLVTSQIQYLRNAPNQTACEVTGDILVVEPDGAGPFPVFIYTGGTIEVGPDGTDFAVDTIAIVTEAARQGFVAAAVEYEDTTLPGFCNQQPGFFKTRCTYSTSSNPQSAVSAVCARPKAGCATHGIVTSGFSQGGALAALARNFDTRVRGTWAMGFADVDFLGFHQPCFDQGTGPLGTHLVRLLSNSRLRLTNGINQGTAILAYNRTTGRNCSNSTTICLNGPNASGWKLALTSELNPGNPARHCFMQNFPGQIFNPLGCADVHTTDPVFARIPPATTFASGLFQNVSWLKNTILPLGNQP